MSALDPYRHKFDSVVTDLQSLFEVCDSMEEENAALKERNEKLVKCINQMLLKYEPSENKRRLIRKNCGIIL